MVPADLSLLQKSYDDTGLLETCVAAFCAFIIMAEQCRRSRQVVLVPETRPMSRFIVSSVRILQVLRARHITICTHE